MQFVLKQGQQGLKETAGLRIFFYDLTGCLYFTGFFIPVKTGKPILQQVKVPPFKIKALVQQIIHYGSHFMVPVFIALWLYRQHWLRAYAVLLLTMMVDIDHLLSAPVYEACRCSIGFHLLHSYPAIGIYILLLFFRPARLVAIGLVWHMFTDYMDCLLQAVYCK